MSGHVTSDKTRPNHELATPWVNWLSSTTRRARLTSQQRITRETGYRHGGHASGADRQPPFSGWFRNRRGPSDRDAANCASGGSDYSYWRPDRYGGHLCVADRAWI